MREYTQEKDGTIIGDDGKIFLFSIERFKRNIVFGNCCFICGVKITEENRSQEHVLPNWILRKFNLHDKNITLPNLSTFRYSQYVIPCCETCNGLMAETFEAKIAPTINGGLEKFAELVQEDGFRLIYNWMALIFLKTHLKDAQLRENLDQRAGDETLGKQAYDYEALHHVHCLARSFYTEAIWDNYVNGSLYIGPAKSIDGTESFDFADNFIGKTTLLRMNDICILAVFNDGGAVMQFMTPNYIEKFTNGLTPIQIREFFTRFTHCNLSIKTHPIFQSIIDGENGYKIIANVPSEIQFYEFNHVVFGELMWNYCREFITASGKPLAETEAEIKRGIFSYILDEKQNFNTKSMVVMKGEQGSI